MGARLNRLTLNLMLLAATLGSGCVRAPALALEDHPPLPAPATLRVTYDGFVNAGYAGGRRLDGWQATSLVIEKTLAAWYPSLEVRRRLTDPSAEEVSRGLSDLPGPPSADLSIVYLGSRQDAAGAWEFTQGGPPVSWGRLLQEARVPVHPNRVAILDACFASAVLRFPPWRGQFAPAALFAAAEDEWTCELDFSTPRPLDLAQRFPRAAAWLGAHMPPSWEGKLSFLGLVWLQAFLRTERAPVSRADWAAFFRLCSEEAGAFRENHSRRLASTVHGYAD
jgi:hypothetical protein